MSYRKAIKDAKVALKEANLARTKKVSICTYNFKKAKKAFAEQEHLFKEAYDKELLIARCGDLSLYADKIVGDGISLSLSPQLSVSLNRGGEIIYNTVAVTDIRHTDTRVIFLTFTSPEGRFTVQEKPEDEADAYHFVDAVYNTTRRLDELAKEKEEKSSRNFSRNLLRSMPAKPLWRRRAQLCKPPKPTPHPLKLPSNSSLTCSIAPKSQGSIPTEEPQPSAHSDG